MTRGSPARAGLTALALLVCACVFVAIGGPAQSLHIRTQALHKTLDPLAPITKAVQESAQWANVVTPPDLVTQDDLTGSASDIGHGISRDGVPLRPGAWAGLSTAALEVDGGVSRRAYQAGTPPKIEIIYRDPLAANARLVAGQFAAGTAAGTAAAKAPAGAVAVSVSGQTAARFGLSVGSVFTVGGADATGRPNAVSLVVTGIFEPLGPGSTFWHVDPVAAAPSLNGGSPTSLPRWIGAAIADPDQLASVQNTFGQDLELQWEFPLDLSTITADQATSLEHELNNLLTAQPAVRGGLSQAAGQITVSTAVIGYLQAFLATQAQIQTVLLLLFVSLAMIGLAVIVLAAMMIALRRADELTLLRSRGASLRQIAALLLRACAQVAVPAAAIGAGLAFAFVPDARQLGSSSSTLGLSLAASVLAVAVAGPALVAAWQHRKPAHAGNAAKMTTAETGRARRLTQLRRPVAELTATAAAVAGLVVLHAEGLPADGSTNPLLTLAPTLLAIPVVIVVLRLYPLAVRGLLRLAARGSGATAFLALARAARTSLASLLPALSLVLALSLAAFAGMLSDGIAAGEVTSSWQTAGADVMISTGANGNEIPPATLKALAAVHGVRMVTPVWLTSWQTLDGKMIEVAAVPPESYARLVATTPFPRFPVAKVGTASGGALAFGASVPVIATPAAAATLGAGQAQLSSLYAMGPVTVKVADTLSGGPAQAAGADVVMPLRTLPGSNGVPAPDVAFLSGSGIDDAQVSSLVLGSVSEGVVTFRSAVLHGLTSSPLQSGAATILLLTIVISAGFGLFVLLLGLALGAADRELALARLTAMGLDSGTNLVLAESVPAVVTAALAGFGCALALPTLVGTYLDLTVFTGSGAPVTLRPDLTALGLPAAATVLMTLITLAIEARRAH